MLSSTAKVNPDLALEREKASFNPIELSYLLHGGRQKIERKRYLGTVIYVISFLGYFAKTCNVNSSFRKVKHARSLWISVIPFLENRWRAYEHWLSSRKKSHHIFVYRSQLHSQLYKIANVLPTLMWSKFSIKYHLMSTLNSFSFSSNFCLFIIHFSLFLTNLLLCLLVIQLCLLLLYSYLRLLVLLCKGYLHGGRKIHCSTRQILEGRN